MKLIAIESKMSKPTSLSYLWFRFVEACFLLYESINGDLSFIVKQPLCKNQKLAEQV